MFQVASYLFGVEESCYQHSSTSDKRLFKTLTILVLTWCTTLFVGCGLFFFLAFNSFFLSIFGSIGLGLALTNIVLIVMISIQIPNQKQFPENLSLRKLFLRVNNVFRIFFLALIGQFILLALYFACFHDVVINNNNQYKHGLILDKKKEIEKNQIRIKESLILEIESLRSRLANYTATDLTNDKEYWETANNFQEKQKQLNIIIANTETDKSQQIKAYEFELEDKLFLNTMANLIINDKNIILFEVLLILYILFILKLKFQLITQTQNTYIRESFEMYKSAIEAHYTTTKIHIDNMRMAKGNHVIESVYVDPPFNTQLLKNYSIPELIPIDQLNGN
jgi:hypothetical protein